MNIIGIIGSPRHGKNVDSLVRKVLEGAQAAGHNAEAFFLNDLDIRPCQGCTPCPAEGFCRIQDDMQPIYTALEQADALVIGTPVYFDHISAQTKIFIDRLNAVFGPDLQSRLAPGKRAVLALAWAEANPDQYDDVIRWLEGRLTGYFSMRVVGVLKAPDADSQPARQNPNLLQQAFEVGRNLV